MRCTPSGEGLVSEYGKPPKIGGHVGNWKKHKGKHHQHPGNHHININVIMKIPLFFFWDLVCEVKSQQLTPPTSMDSAAFAAVAFLFSCDSHGHRARKQRDQRKKRSLWAVLRGLFHSEY